MVLGPDVELIHQDQFGGRVDAHAAFQLCQAPALRHVLYQA